MKNNSIKAISFFTAAFMMFAVFAPCVPAAGDTVSISSVNDFKNFTEKCVYDEYSKNKKFVLQNDIDLSGAEIKSAEIFCGEFEGGNHTLKNVSFTSESVIKGLFSEVSKDAVIKDLHVTGDMKLSSSSSRESLIRKRAESFLKKRDIIDTEDTEDGASGGIAGYNEGKIINCSYGGKLRGQKNTGGIAGINAMTGVIDSCTNAAEISADSEAGGIAGYNEGRIKLSKNSGVICAEANENTTNVGGICGNSKGAVVICTNDGAVGGKKFGDNIGGVCGAQSGEIRECINNGFVNGRRSVGGICGRFEPYTDIDLSYESARAAIEKQAETLKNDLQDGKTKILDYALDLIDGNGDLSDLLSLVGISDGNTSDRLNNLTNSATRMMDSIADAANSLSDSGLTDSLKSLSDDVSRAGSDVSEFLEDNKDVLRDTSNSLTNSLESLDSVLHEFDGVGGDIDRLVDNLNDAVDKGEGDFDEARNSLTDRLDRLEDSMDDAMDDLDDTREELNRLLKQTRSAVGEMENAFEEIDTMAENISRELSRIRASIENFNQNIENKFPHSTLRPITIPTSIPIPTLRPRNGSYGEYEVETDTDSVGAGYEVETVGKITDILFPKAYAAEAEEKIAITALRSTDISIPRLIGGENADTALIKYCVNNGAVEGTELSGGIAGSVGFESSLKSGENITLPNGKKVSTDSVLKAVTDSCISYGNITASDKYAGGIIGRGDTGSVKNSLSTGEITVDDGGFAGGTAGQSSGEIINCIAVNDIAANENLGGIAGSARDIKNSYALPRLDGKKSNSGAVAGAVSGELLNCYFIDEGLPGIDGMNLEGKAEAVKPNDMVSSDGSIPVGMKNLSPDDYYMASGDIYLPQIKAIAENKAENIGAILQSKSAELSRFHFNVRFIDKGKELKSMTVDYGTKLTESDIPKLDANGGEVPVWDRDVTEPIIRHTVFTAEYNKAATTISTGEEPPLLLVEGIFDDNTSVTAREENADRTFSGCKNGKAYSFTLSRASYGSVKVHIRNDKKPADKAAVFKDGQWELTDCVTDGSYAVFEAAGPCEFILLYKRPSAVLIILIGLGIAALLAAVFAIVWRIKNGRSKKEENVQELHTVGKGDNTRVC